MSISIIAAISENNCIGKNGELPWHIPEDLKHFKKITTGKTVIMGRKTWESLPEQYKPLPQRKNIVITRQSHYSVPLHVEVYASLDIALSTHQEDDICIIGGGEIYKAALPLADTLYITQIHNQVDGDTFFPTISPQRWQEISKESHDTYSFVTYKKI